MVSLVVLCDLALGVFFKIVIMRGISGAALGGQPRVASAHVHTHARTHIHTRGDQNKLLPDISDLKPKIYG